MPFGVKLDSDGQLTVDLYNDKIDVPSPSEKPLLLPTMRKYQAVLDLFALATENERSKQLYQKSSRKIQKVIDLISPF